VAPLLGDRVGASLEAAGIDHQIIVLPPGEATKSFDQFEEFFFEYKDGGNWVKIVNEPDPDISNGQFPWTLKEVNIPDSINSLELRFRWSSSHGGEHLMIDNLEVFGIPN